jgi:hypothetical protein
MKECCALAVEVTKKHLENTRGHHRAVHGDCSADHILWTLIVPMGMPRYKLVGVKRCPD